MSLIPIILSGGSGTRLWPLSRKLMPKQFLPLAGESTMLQATLQRLNGMGGIASPVVVCNEDHRFTVAEQLRQMGTGHHGARSKSKRNTFQEIMLHGKKVHTVES